MSAQEIISTWGYFPIDISGSTGIFEKRLSQKAGQRRSIFELKAYEFSDKPKCMGFYDFYEDDRIRDMMVQLNSRNESMIFSSLKVYSEYEGSGIVSLLIKSAIPLLQAEKLNHVLRFIEPEGLVKLEKYFRCMGYQPIKDNSLLSLHYDYGK